MLTVAVQGLSRDKSSHVQNSLWVYDINKNRWSVDLTLSSPVVSSGYTSKCSVPYCSNTILFNFLTIRHSGAQS